MIETIIDSITDSPSSTEELARSFSQGLKNGDFVAMFGDLGAGKTAFTRGLLSGLIPEAEFSGSPTYALVNEYEGNKIKLSHFDMYRITDDEDLYSIGFYDYTDGIVVTEWSENIIYALPKQRYEVHIEKIDDNKRNILIQRVDADK